MPAIAEPTPHQRTMQRFGRTAGLLAVLSFCSAALAFLRESSFALRFGTSTAMDAYVAANFVPRLVTAVASGAIMPGFMLLFIRCKESDSAAAWEFTSAAVNWTLLVFTFVGVLMACTSRFWLRLIYAGYSPSTLQLSVRLSLILLPPVALLITAGLISGVLNATGNFGLPAIVPGIASVVLIAVVLLARGAHAIYIVAIATAASFLLQLALQLPALRLLKIPRLFRWTWNSQGLQAWVGLSVPLLLYQIVAFGSNAVEGHVASRLGSGSVSTLAYAMRLFTVPAALVAIPIATVAFPALSRHAVREDWHAMRAEFGRAMRMTVFLFLPASTYMLILARPITQLTFERGAFGPAATKMTAAALAYFSLGLLPNAIAILALRGMYARSQMLAPVLCESVSLVIYAMVAPALARSYDVRGLALARTLTFSATTILLLVVLHFRTRLLEGLQQWTAFIAKSVTATALMGVVCSMGIFLYGKGDSLGRFTLPLMLLLATLTGGVVYLGTSWVLGIAEAESLLSWLRARFRSFVPFDATKLPGQS